MLMKKYVPYLFAVLFAYFCFYGVSIYIPYQLCQLEHESMFVGGVDAFHESLGQLGGLGEWMALWATQFFALWGWGSWFFILPVLVFLVTLSLFHVKKEWSLPIAAFIGQALLLSMFDYHYSWAGGLSLSLVVIGLFLITRIKSEILKMLLFLICIPAMLWFFGSATIVLLVGGLCLLTNAKNWKYLIPVSISIYALLAVSIYQFGLIRSMTNFVSPVFYHQLESEFSGFHYIPWLLTVLFIMVFRIIEFPNIKRKSIWWLVNIAMWILPCGLFMKFSSSFISPYDQALYRLNHYAYSERWDSVLRLLRAYPMDNWMFMNYANMALANTGQLGDKAFLYKPLGEAALMVNPNPSGLVRMLKSDINYTVGCIAESQHQAFDAQVAYHKELGIQTLKRLVQTNIILGHYEVAEKYLSLIGQTMFYKEWADKYKVFLYNDEAVLADAELGKKRKSLINDNRFAMVNGWISELEEIVTVNPDNKEAVEYLGIAYLLGKDLDAFEKFVERHYSACNSTVVPDAFQQAIVLLYNRDEEKCKSYQIDHKVMDEYVRFNEWYEKNKNKSDCKNVMAAEFGHTFWYYSKFV